MQIILINESGSKRASFLLSKIVVASVTVSIVAVVGFVGYLGSHWWYEEDYIRQSLNITQAYSIWDAELDRQGDLLEDTRESLYKNLDAMVSRLAKLNAHIVRLDALGSRLASIAQIDDIDFDSSNSLGIGGPNPEINSQSSMDVSHFLALLEQLSLQVEDRRDKLQAIESIFMGQFLEDQAILFGSPIEGGWVSSHYGLRTDPITGKLGKHYGIDFSSKGGASIYVVGSGIVTWSGWHNSYGHFIEVSHGKGYQTRYAHNKKNLVQVGDRVAKGQKIALMGSSGRSTGNHLHFEILKNGKLVNPYNYLTLKK